MTEMLQVGQLLVATPALEDPNFERSVIFMLAHTEEGALGVVLNRANDVPVAELLPAWHQYAAEPDCVFVGGPVYRSSIIGLARLRPGEPGYDGCQAIHGRVATLDLNREPGDLVAGIEAVRLFSGYAGWDEEQLEGEIACGSWLACPSMLDDLFTPDPGGLWRRVMRRQGGRYAMYANAPPKLSMN